MSLIAAVPGKTGAMPLLAAGMDVGVVEVTVSGQAGDLDAVDVRGQQQ